jgi:hypothetical protein
VEVTGTEEVKKIMVDGIEWSIKTIWSVWENQGPYYAEEKIRKLGAKIVKWD